MILYLLVNFEEAVRGLTLSGKKVFAITRTVCSPTPVILSRGKRKGLVPAWKNKERKKRGGRETE